MSKKITFIDNIGRNILAEFVKSENGILAVKNPTVINIAQADNGQLQVQIIPLFLPEFLTESSKATGTVWNYPLNCITTCEEFEIDARLLSQYERISSGALLQQAPQQAAEAGESVVKLFDE